MRISGAVYFLLFAPYKCWQLLGQTNREIEVCELVKDGRTYKEIGEELFISQRTVNKHIQHIFKKANSNNKVELLNTISGR